MTPQSLHKPHRARPRAAALALLVLVSAGCRVADAKIWNLRQVHQADGSPKRMAAVRSDTGYLIRNALAATNFGSEEFRKTQGEEKVDDPHGVCLENLVELADLGREDPRVLADKVELMAWLVSDCAYVLTRERCALELGDIGRRLQVEGPLELPLDLETSGPEEVGAALTSLIEAARPSAVEGGGALTAGLLRERCEALGALTLDLAGARRLLAAANVLLEGREDEPVLAPLAAVRQALERRCVRLALGAALRDPEPRVRAAAIGAAVVASRNRVPDVLRDGLALEASTEEKLAALGNLAARGVPEEEPESPDDGEAPEASWIRTLVGLLEVHRYGPVSVAACRAMAALLGEPENLRPEHWVVAGNRRLGAAVEPPDSMGREPR